MIIALVIETITAYCAVLVVGAMNHGTAVVVPCAMWIFLIMAESILHQKLLKKKHRYSTLYLFNGISVLLNIFLLLHFSTGVNGTGDVLVIAVISLILSIRIPVMLMSEFSDRQMLVHFELAFLQAVMYLVLLDTGYALPVEGTICVLIAPVLGFLCLVAMRGGNHGLKTPILIGLSSIFALLAATSVCFQAQVGIISTKAVAIGDGIFQWIGWIFYKIACFLASLVVDASGPVETDEIVSALNKNNQNTDSGVDLGFILKIILLFFVVVVVITLIIVLVKGFRKKKRFLENKENYVNYKNIIQIESGNLLEKLWKRILFEFFYYKNRKNELGTLIWLKRYGKKIGISYESGMTVRQYLEQLSQTIVDSPEGLTLLKKLVNRLDLYFYGADDTNIGNPKIENTKIENTKIEDELQLERLKQLFIQKNTQKAGKMQSE